MDLPGGAAPDATAGRPIGFEGGVDFELVLRKSGRFSLVGEVSGVRFLSDDPAQLLATAGTKWAGGLVARPLAGRPVGPGHRG